MHLKRTAVPLSALMLALSVSAWAQSFPSKTVRIITLQVPGSSIDVGGRVYADLLSKKWGQHVVMENRPGAFGFLAGGVVVNSPPDGYAILLTANMALVSQVLPKDRMPYDHQSDLMPLAQIATLGYGLMVGADHPAKSVDELIKYARANAATVSYAAVSPIAHSNLAARMFFDHVVKVKPTQLNYKGSTQMLQDVASGRVPMMFETLGTALGMLKGGKLRLLAVTSPKREELYPNVPTMEELGYKPFNVTNWLAFYLHGKTPRALAERISADMAQVAAMPEVRDKLLGLSLTPNFLGITEFTASHKPEWDKWSRLIKELNIKLEQ